MTRDALFAKARQLQAQSPTPTTLREQLSILSRRRNYGKTTITRTLERTQVETPKHYWWNREDAP